MKMVDQTTAFVLGFGRVEGGPERDKDERNVWSRFALPWRPLL